MGIEAIATAVPPGHTLPARVPPWGQPGNALYATLMLLPLKELQTVASLNQHF